MQELLIRMYTVYSLSFDFGQLTLKKWLFPHKSRSPCLSRVLLSMAEPLTQVLQEKPKNTIKYNNNNNNNNNINNNYLYLTHKCSRVPPAIVVWIYDTFGNIF